MKINVFLIICLLGLLIFFGAVGASDLESITVTELAWRSLVGIAMILFGGIGGYKFENR